MWVFLVAASLAAETVEIPLVAGASWTYEVRERPAGGARVLGLGQGGGPARTLGTWTLVLQAPTEGRFPAVLRKEMAESAPITTHLSVWQEGGQVWVDTGEGVKPAFEATLPDDPLIVERFACTAHLLGGVRGVCAARWGGPLGEHPGLQVATLGGSSRSARLTQAVVGIATGGVLLPGGDAPLVTLELVGFEGPTPSGDWPLYRAWKARPVRGAAAGPALVQRIASHGADAESVGAILATTKPEEVGALAAAALPEMPTSDRVALARVTLATAPWVFDQQLQALARISPALDGVPHTERLLAFWKLEKDLVVAEALLSGPAPVLVEVVLAAPYDDRRLSALKAALRQNSPGEAAAAGVVARMGSKASRKTAMALLLEHTALDRRAASLARQLTTLFGRERLAVLGEHLELLRSLDTATKRELVAGFAFKRDREFVQQLLLGDEAGGPSP